MLVVREGDALALKQLIKYRVDLNMWNAAKKSALLYAAEHREKRRLLLQILLEAGAAAGWTEALVYVTERGLIDDLRLLLDHAEMSK